MNFQFIILPIFFILFHANLLNAQENIAPLTTIEKEEVIQEISRLMNENYVFPEIAVQMSDLLQANSEAGKYASIKDPHQFAEALTYDLLSVSNDKHIRVNFAPDRIAAMRSTRTPEDSLAFINRQMENMRRNNFGFREVKILDGNIGYIDLRGFSNTEYASETAIAAMNFVSNADALIIDLRYNGGGSPSMIQLISSYLFNSEPVHLNSFYFRPTDENTQTWTLPYVPGKRRPDMDVYVLTSNSTFSAAEEFSYNLKNLKRATLVGETTGGGAHPGGTRIATDRFLVWVPTGRAINPITHTNWEGTGVVPHIETSATQAFDKAYFAALEVLAGKDPENPLYQWHLQGLQARLNPVIVPEKKLRSYTGQYGPRTITFEDGRLYYQREGRAKFPLIPLDSDLFAIEELPGFRVKIIMENGMVTGLMGMYDNGTTDLSPVN